MKFTYDDYFHYLRKIADEGYTLTNFRNHDKCSNPAIIRHDIDLSPVKALEMAKSEAENGVQSTYFVLVSSNYYNLCDRENEQAIREIAKLGHEVGLHFDITKYDNADDLEALQAAVYYECNLLSAILGGQEIDSLSWHIPAKKLIGKHIELKSQKGVLYNAYDPYFFNGFKYVSDSMMRWRESLDDVIDKEKYSKLQVMTHPVWYFDEQNRSNVEILDEVFKTRKNELSAYLETIRPGFGAETENK